MKNLHIVMLALLLLQGCGGSEQATTTVSTESKVQFSQTVSLAANSWVQGQPERTAELVTEQGIRHWQQQADVLTVFLHTRQSGTLQLGLSGRVVSGQTGLELELAGQRQKVQLKAGAFSEKAVAEFSLSQSGYQQLQLRGLSRQGATFADLDQLHLAGSAAEGASFIKDEVYWGRRGPSVHFSYSLPQPQQSQWFYSEMRVPQGQDIIGSYFMAAGFADGYFGIQVNSADERRVLFSVWSPYQTDDPASIPPEDQVKLLRKGAEVQTGEFGNEGSGGQSFLRYPWQAEQRYGFLLKAQPQADGYTHYSAWFYPPEQGQWQLIASFARPKTQRYIERPHSFLENFMPEMGEQGRSVLYPAQWFADPEGHWVAASSARFSVDNTGARGNRLDYKGAFTAEGLLLQNGGFFSDTTAAGTEWPLPAPARGPLIDFTVLP